MLTNPSCLQQPQNLHVFDVTFGPSTAAGFSLGAIQYEKAKFMLWDRGTRSSKSRCKRFVCNTIHCYGNKLRALLFLYGACSKNKQIRHTHTHTRTYTHTHTHTLKKCKRSNTGATKPMLPHPERFILTCNSLFLSLSLSRSVSVSFSLTLLFFLSLSSVVSGLRAVRSQHVPESLETLAFAHGALRVS